jgi:hypothetical protein
MTISAAVQNELAPPAVTAGSGLVSTSMKRYTTQPSAAHTA